MMIQPAVEATLNEPYVNMQKISFLQLTMRINVLK